jgi:hypothetical protein
MLAVRVVADVWRLYVPEQRLVDTAADYRNEEQVGAALRASGMPRELLFVVSKLGPLNQGFERARRRRSRRRSLCSTVAWSSRLDLLHGDPAVSVGRRASRHAWLGVLDTRRCSARKWRTWPVAGEHAWL